MGLFFSLGCIGLEAKRCREKLSAGKRRRLVGEEGECLEIQRDF